MTLPAHWAQKHKLREDHGGRQTIVVSYSVVLWNQVVLLLLRYCLLFLSLSLIRKEDVPQGPHPVSQTSFNALQPHQADRMCGDIRYLARGGTNPNRTTLSQDSVSTSALGSFEVVLINSRAGCDERERSGRQGVGASWRRLHGFRRTPPPHHQAHTRHGEPSNYRRKR